MQPRTWLAHVDLALSLLPPRLTSDTARAMLVAVALQESDLRHRRQIGGPAVSYLMWEPGSQSALPGLLRHRASSGMAAEFTAALDYADLTPEELRQACITDSVLCAGLGRLLIWTLPEPLPANVLEAYSQYIAAWRPGKPTKRRWPSRWRQAWETVG